MFEEPINAFHLIFSSQEVYEIALRSIKVSGVATLMALCYGLPLGLIIGFFRFPGRVQLKSFFNAMLGVPTVALGLLLYLMLVPKGPLGSLGLLYTENGISLGQSLLVAPIIVSFIANSIEAVEKDIRELAYTLGASNLQASLSLIREASNGVVLSTIAAFNRAISELGIAIMIGGNIFVRDGAYNTRVLTTAMQMYVSRGETDIALALGLILIGIVFTISSISNYIHGKLAGD
jgi:tungstate transport system permease protein